MGKKYQSQEDKHKVLIVAESVYDWEPGKEDSREWLRRKDFARRVVRQHRLDFESERPKISPTYKNLERAIYGRKDIEDKDVKDLWLSVSVHQYVQRPMKNKGERPSTDDYENGAPILKCILSILKPRLCIILGTDWKKVKPILREKFASSDEKRGYEIIGQSRPRVLNCMVDCRESKILMIQHPSHHFSWKEWYRQFLSKEAPQYSAHMKALNKH